MQSASDCPKKTKTAPVTPEVPAATLAIKAVLEEIQATPAVEPAIPEVPAEIPATPEEAIPAAATPADKPA